MKRAFAIVAFLLIFLLCTGPASAAIRCALSNSAMGSSCPMGMAGMDADCPMSHALSAGNCSQDCCNRAAPIAPVVNGVPVKPRLVATEPLMARLTGSTVEEGDSGPQISSILAATSPPRYILLRVFRI